MKKSKEIKQKLLELSDLEYKKFNNKLCPDTKREMLGIRIPILRKFAQTIIKENTLKEALNSIDENFFEEIMLQGLVIGYAKIPLKEKCTYIKEFIPKIDSWAITDTFVPTLKIKEKDLDEFWKFILPYTKSKKEFEIRFSVISMLDYFITDKYIDEVIKILDSIKHEGYYVKMAVAWTLAEIGVKFNYKAIKYLTNENNLDKFTYNKTLQKMIESYRINENQKDILRKMKIK